MADVMMFSNARNLRTVLEPYKGKPAKFSKVPLDFEAINLNAEALKSGRFPVIKKSLYLDAFGYNRYGDNKVLKVNSRHSNFKATLLDWEVLEYDGGGRWGRAGDNGWDTVWLHFETMTGQGLPFHLPLRLAIQNGKLASVWQDSLLEYGLIEGVDFKFNTLGDMLILSPEGKDAIELVDPPKPMVIQFSAQIPVNELSGAISVYWDKPWPKSKEQFLYPRYRMEACRIGIDVL